MSDSENCKVWKSILLAIPALNEERHIGPLLFEINSQYPALNVLVIDDGSEDATAQIAFDQHCNLIKHAKNEGKGFCIREALQYACQKEFEWVITMDADNQHRPIDIGNLIKLMACNNVDLIIANRRIRRGKMPYHRQMSNGITSLLVSLVGGGQRVHDSQCGFRAYRVSKFVHINAVSNGFQFESEILINALKSGMRISQMDIETVYSNQKSSINLVKDTFAFLRLIGSFILRS